MNNNAERTFDLPHRHQRRCSTFSIRGPHRYASWRAWFFGQFTAALPWAHDRSQIVAHGGIRILGCTLSVWELSECRPNAQMLAAIVAAHDVLESLQWNAKPIAKNGYVIGVPTPSMDALKRAYYRCRECLGLK